MQHCYKLYFCLSLQKELATTKGKLTETQDQLKTHQQKQKVRRAIDWQYQSIEELLNTQKKIKYILCTGSPSLQLLEILLN